MELLASDDLMKKLLRDEIHRVCNATMSAPWDAAHVDWKKYDELILVCKGCRRDTTELERALNAAKDALLHLKHATDFQTCSMRRAIETSRVDLLPTVIVRPHVEDYHL
jgi:hypothetical protein